MIKRVSKIQPCTGERMFDGIEYRGFDHSYVEELAEHSGVPVWNGLTDQWHPTQPVSNDADTERALRIPEGG